MAPADRGAQCLLPFGSVAPTRCEQVEGTVQPLEQRFGREKPQPGGGQLERERQTIQTPAHGGDGVAVLGRELE